MQVFDFKGYKKFIQAMIDEQASTRGYQSKLAEAAGCQTSYFSKVLLGDGHFSLEQGIGLTAYWGFSNDETDYFLELIIFERAGNARLRERSLQRLQDMRLKQENLANRFKEAGSLSFEDHAYYYSSWHIMAIHLLSGVAGFHTVEAISRSLSMEQGVVASTLHKLRTLNLVQHTAKGWMTTPGHIHLPKESPLNSVNHSNWRQRALVDAQNPSSIGLHFTSVQTHGKDDLDRIKKVLLQSIDSVADIVRPAKNEEMTAMCLDFFTVYPK